VHTYIKMPGLDVAAADGTSLGKLCGAALGESFAAGTIDGPGMFDFTQGKNSTNLFWRMIVDLLHTPTKEEAACQAPKGILLPTGSLTFPYPWAPDTVPLQLLQVGQLVIAAVPTEMTTMAGRRLRKALLARLQASGVLGSSGRVVVAGLSNGYADYTVTFEEYQEQRYEGGSTIFGPHQLEAYIQQSLRLADHLANGTAPKSDPPPVDFTSKLIDTTPSLKTESAPHGKAFGDVLADAPATVAAGSVVEAAFVGGSLRNAPSDVESFLRVERQVEGSWQVVALDGDVETRLHAAREDSHVRVGIRWDVPASQPAGNYRISHSGAYRKFHLIGKDETVKYSGSSRVFAVTAPSATVAKK